MLSLPWDHWVFYPAGLQSSDVGLSCWSDINTTLTVFTWLNFTLNFRLLESDFPQAHPHTQGVSVPEEAAAQRLCADQSLMSLLKMNQYLFLLFIYFMKNKLYY